MVLLFFFSVELRPASVYMPGFSGQGYCVIRFYINFYCRDVCLRDVVQYLLIRPCSI